MAHEAFEYLQDDRHVWAEFERAFSFKLDYQRGAGSAIDEPPGSVTIDLSPTLPFPVKRAQR